MRSSKSRGKYFLQCQTRHYSKDACVGAFISADKLEEMVISELHRLSAEYLDMDELERRVEFSTELIMRKKQLEGDIVSYQKKIGEFSKGLRDLYLDKVKGLFCEADYAEFYRDFTAQKERLENQIKESEKQILEIIGI